MTKYTLKADKRTLFGKKVNRLRRQGVIPATVFGKGADTASIQISLKEFEALYKKAGETSIVNLHIEGEDKDRPTLITGIAYHPVSDVKLHVDFHQVNLKEKVSANVPVEIIGESALVKAGTAVLVQSVHEIEIEALPTEIPEKIIFDISSLKEIGDHLKVSDAKLDQGVELKTDPEVTVVALSELQKEEVVEAPAGEEGAAAPVAGEAKPAEGEAKKEETPKS